MTAPRQTRTTDTRPAPTVRPATAGPGRHRPDRRRTAAAADALSTAFFVIGAAEAHCRPRPGLAAVVLPAGPDAGILVTGLPPTRYDPPEL